jgi:NADH-quinone oxidoreductase subunit M
MTYQDVPWLELAALTSILGAGAALLSRTPLAWSVASSAAALALTLVEWLPSLFGFSSPHRLAPWLEVDGFSAPLLPLTALLHFAAALSAPRTISTSPHFALLLLSLGVQLLTFGCVQPWVLTGLLAAGACIPLAELLLLGRPCRLFVGHMALFVGMLAGGLACLQAGMTLAGQALLLAAALLRCGTAPLHSWATELFAQARFGTALVFVAPLVGVYAAARLVLPTQPPEALLKGLGLFSLVTALVAAGLAMVQRDARRFFALLIASKASVVMVGLEIGTEVSLTGAFSFWVAASLSLAGLGLVLRAIEARFGRLMLDDYQGLYRHTPSLAGCFLVMGLASVGFPGTLGFITSEVLVNSAVRHSSIPGFVLIAAGAMNGIAVMRIYFLLFAGPGHPSTLPLTITPRERLAVLALTLLVLGGGLFPQPGLASRYQAALAVLKKEPAPHPGHGHAPFQ